MPKTTHHNRTKKWRTQTTPTVYTWTARSASPQKSAPLLSRLLLTPGDWSHSCKCKYKQPPRTRGSWTGGSPTTRWTTSRTREMPARQMPSSNQPRRPQTVHHRLRSRRPRQDRQPRTTAERSSTGRPGRAPYKTPSTRTASECGR